MRTSRAAEFTAAGRGAEMLADGIARQRLDLGSAGVVAERPDLLGVKAFRDQLALGLGDDLVEAIVAVADAARAALDAEFLRRHAEHARLGHLARRDDGDVVRERRRRGGHRRLRTAEQERGYLGSSRASVRASQHGSGRKSGNVHQRVASGLLDGFAGPACGS